MYNVIIIGGGASGLFLSVLLSEKGVKTLILEKEDRVGKKLVRTGNSKCNFTNRELCLRHYHGKTAVIANAIQSFNLEKTLQFFNDLGIEYAADKEGRVYPRSYQAHAVLDVLRFKAEENGVLTECNKNVFEIEQKDNGFTVKTSDGGKYNCEKVVVSTGGKAGLAKQSDSVYEIIKKMGHDITEMHPALVQLSLKEKEPSQMSGMRWSGGVSLYIDNERVQTSSGDILFTDYGISGDAVLDISREAVLALSKNRLTEIHIDLFPDISIADTKIIIKERVKRFSNRKSEHFFTGVLNKKIGRTLLQYMGFNLNDEIIVLTGYEDDICRTLHDWVFRVRGHNGWSNAQVTAGGVSLDSLDENSLESKNVKGLFFTGEVIDVDGDCGGYNLQWAWSSAYVVSKSIIKNK